MAYIVMAVCLDWLSHNRRQSRDPLKGASDGSRTDMTSSQVCFKKIPTHMLIVMAYIVMVYAFMAYTIMPYTVMAYIGLAHIAMACVVMASKNCLRACL